MHWLLIITLTYHGKTAEIPWARTLDASLCTITGGAVVTWLRTEDPELSAQFRCLQEKRA